MALTGRWREPNLRLIERDRSSFGNISKGWPGLGRIPRGWRRTMGVRKALVAVATAAVVTTGLAVAVAQPASAASLQEITNFGNNPSGLRMFLYVPDVVQPRPGVLLAVHYCTGSGPAFFNGTEFRTLADRFGFIVIYPSATRSGACFDVSSAQALRHNGGSDPVGIMSMVTYVIQSYGADANRVYVTGASSGAMMTNVLLGN